MLCSCHGKSKLMIVIKCNFFTVRELYCQMKFLFVIVPPLYCHISPKADVESSLKVLNC